MASNTTTRELEYDAAGRVSREVTTTEHEIIIREMEYDDAGRTIKETTTRKSGDETS